MLQLSNYLGFFYLLLIYIKHYLANTSELLSFILLKTVQTAFTMGKYQLIHVYYFIHDSLKICN